MKKSHTFYEALGLKPGVPMSEVKRAYRLLVKDHHPDLNHSKSNKEQLKRANERMRKINEAYSTLIDKTKRAAYDLKIGLVRAHYTYAVVNSSRVQEEACEHFMKNVFNPARRAIYTQLRKYPHQLHLLSGDIYDEELLAHFEKYVEDLEQTLVSCSSSIASTTVPSVLEGAVRMIRYSLSQAADGLDEIRHFYSNFDYKHLAMADNLFRISLELSAESARLAKV
jgi:curved DNA-binding protein CbpA